MDLKIFFEPVNELAYTGINEPSSFYCSIKVNGEQMPSYKDADIAVIGVVDERGSKTGEGLGLAPNEIRKKLYPLKKGSGAYKIIDLGDLRLGPTYDDTLARLQEVCEILIDSNVLPLIIGGSHDLDLAVYKSYETMDKLINVLNVDAQLDMSDARDVYPNVRHIQDILVHEPNYLFNYSHLGYQSYLVEKSAISTLEMLYFDLVRLGEMRKNIVEMEPIVRNADTLSFDISAIRSGDAPGSSIPYAFGLSGEEACQLCWYAGISEKLSSAGFYEYNPLLDDQHKKTAQVISVMIWYFIEGYYHRKNEKDFKSTEYLKYVVSMPVEPASLSFYKSKLSDKWWMEIPHPHQLDTYIRNRIVPCSYKDYEQASKGDLPDRYISALAKFI